MTPKSEYRFDSTPNELFERRVEALLWREVSKEHGVLVPGRISPSISADFFIPHGLKILGTENIPTYVEALPSIDFSFVLNLRRSIAKKNSNFVLFVVYERGPVLDHELAINGGLEVRALSFHSLLVKIGYQVTTDSNHHSTVSKTASRFGGIVPDLQKAPLLSVETYLANLVYHGQLALILGTGISADFGADLWGKLMSNLLDYLNPTFIKNISGVCGLLGNSVYSESLLTRLILTKARNKDIYYRALHSCIYRKFTGFFPDTSMLYGTAVFIKKHSPMVLTFNYDDYLEQQMSQLKSPMKACWNKTEIAKQSGNPKRIFHVHGYLPFGGKITSKIKDSIVLNEDDYYDFYQNSVVDPRRRLLSNVIAKKNCLFVGTSLSDIFFHVLLKGSSGAGTPHFVMLNGGGLNKAEKDYVREFFEHLHTRAMFYDSFDAITSALKRI